MLRTRSGKVLEAFLKAVAKQAKSNLTRSKKNVTKSLYDSIDYEVLENQNGAIATLRMLPYGDYVDQGVSGTERKYTTPFSYTKKKPPLTNILEWVKARNLYLRDEKGRFKKGGQKSLASIIQNKIFTQGIKPTHFYTKAFEKYYKDLPKDIAEAYSEGMRDMLAQTRSNERLNPNA